MGADDAPLGYFGEWSATGGRSRRFDLQVVSDGTIYIEGDLLSPGAAYLGGLVPFGQVDNATYYRNEALYGSRLALLARDSVCLNTTALNPRPAEMFVPVSATVAEKTDNYFYNDLHRIHPTGIEPGGLWHNLFRGTWPGTSYTADPRPALSTLDDDPAKAQVAMIYTNSRVALWRQGLAEEPASLRLILGHSAIMFDGTDPAVQTATTPPDDSESVDLTLAVTNAAGTQTYSWDGANDYRFLFSPGAANESKHWYSPEGTIPPDMLEFLPVEGTENPSQIMDIHSYLQGMDTLAFSATVVPVPNSDNTSWIVDPRQLGYILGPVAIAPPRTADPLQVEIDALIYAQNGSWFVLPGRWFNDNPAEFSQDPATLPTSEYPGYHEPLNIRISVHGAIGENMPADLGSVADWTSKWCGPVGQEAQHFLSYTYDPLLRYPRRETRDRIGYLRFPNFPLTSDLVIWGERVTGPAGS
jgi:hypothetical protein